MKPPLRRPKNEDVPALAYLFTDSSVRLFLGGPRDDVQAQNCAQGLAALDREFPAWVMIRPGSDLPVGFVSLDRHHDGEDVEISFVLRPDAQGLGIARAAVAAAVDEAWKLGFDRVVAETQSINTRSVHLLQALGFKSVREFIRFGQMQTLFVMKRLIAASDF
ncbi:MAG: N-acetyltransferase [Betaproteobacteria bacterium]|nr:MAG: N-acetyltransferase [Betaproteobacteria bacterium]